jgi:16S rRNA (adenine1518-N6/adenine1519-N6)-dimethyltransferase
MKARLGQHFLVDESVLDFEVQAAKANGMSVLEIGAGDGRLTAKLLAAGASHITAVEIDPRLASLLRKRFGRRVSVFEGDFLGFDEAAHFNVVVGNIPYYITSPILLKLSRMEFDRAVLCMQKEVALRMVAKHGSSNYGRLSVFSQICFQSSILAYVPKEAFEPKPKVDSCIVSLSPTGKRLTAAQERIVGAIFSHRKKSLKNAVVDARQALFGSDDKRKAAEIAQKLKYAKKKVFTLSLDEINETVKELSDGQGI